MRKRKAETVLSDTVGYYHRSKLCCLLRTWAWEKDAVNIVTRRRTFVVTLTLTTRSTSNMSGYKEALLESERVENEERSKSLEGPKSVFGCMRKYWRQNRIQKRGGNLAQTFLKGIDTTVVELAGQDTISFIENCWRKHQSTKMYLKQTVSSFYFQLTKTEGFETQRKRTCIFPIPVKPSLRMCSLFCW